MLIGVMAGRGKSTAAVVGANVAILLIGLVILEAGFGNWLSSNRMNRLNIARDVVRRSDVSALYPSEERVITYTRDQLGFRGRYASVASIDILTLGGSTTDQRYISDGKTWQDVLAKDLLSHGKSVSVVNAGVDGQSTYGHIKAFDWWLPSIPGLRVRYFLFYVGLNDFYKDADYVRDRLVKAPSLQTSIQENSALYHVYRTLDGMYKARMTGQMGHRGIRFAALQWTSRPNLQDHEAVVRERLLAYRGRLRTLAERVAALGSGLICVTQPSRAFKKVDGALFGVAKLGEYDGVTMNGVDYFYMLRLFQRTTLDVCRDMRGISIDLANGVEWEDEDFYDFSHNTPRGAAKIGHRLGTELKDLF